MSESETKNLAELKKDLEERISRAERELNLLKLSLKLVDGALTAVSFQPASRLIERPEPEAPKAVPEPKVAVAPKAVVEPKPLKEVAAPPPTPAAEQSFPIKSKTGEDLGAMHIGKNYVRIVPRSDLIFSVRTPPFQSFFVDRVIGEMRRKDEMAADAGAKDPSSMIEYDIKLDGDTIKEIAVRNIDEDARVRELRSSIRWTLERMLEKTLKP
ncbi:MAG: hypothetical protein FJZ49_08365 [Candidatus Verstraetearchaeota archaeon]|nr:hypothetical protein [Candidatus Verstraetearchaeota archaeon]